MRTLRPPILEERGLIPALKENLARFGKDTRIHTTFRSRSLVELPPDLETLVNGVNRVGALDRKLKFLRRLPVDPMTGTAEWGQRCYQDDPDSTFWCGENVGDVYSKSTAKGLDGTNYNTR